VADSLGDRKERPYLFRSGPRQQKEQPPGGELCISTPDTRHTGEILFLHEAAARPCRHEDHLRRSPSQGDRNVPGSDRGQERASSLFITLQGKKGAVKRKTWKVKALKPGEVFTLREAFRPEGGKTILVATVKDPVNRKNNSMKKTYLPGITALKGLNRLQVRSVPRKVKREHASKPASTGFKAKILTKDLIKKPIPASRISKSRNLTPTTRQGSLSGFLYPRKVDKLALGYPCQIQWSLPEQSEDTRLSLVLTAVDTSQPVPDITLASGLGPNVRAYTWNINPFLPEGTYKLFLLIEAGSAIAGIESDPFRLVSFKFFYKSHAVEPRNPRVGEKVTVSMTYWMNAENVKGITVGCIKIKGPWGFHLGHRMTIEIPETEENGLKLITLKTTFTPPLAGGYYEFFDPDVTNRFPHSADSFKNKQFSAIFVPPLPDLFLFVNKVSDGALNEEKVFKIVVKNIGEASSAPTKVLFQLTGAEDREISIPSLEPGEESVHRVRGKWRRVAGMKTYRAVVDPDNEIVEADETNNEIRDTLRIYSHKDSVPNFPHREPHPKLIVESCYGPEDTVVSGIAYHPGVRFKNVSPDRVPLNEVLVGFFGPEIFFGERTVRIKKLYPGETIVIHPDVGWKTPGPGRFMVKQLSRKGNRIIPVKTLFSKELTVEANPEMMHNVAQAMVQRDSIMSWAQDQNQNQGKSLTILVPNREIFWTKGQRVQIAWTGTAQGPYSVTLFPEGHSNQAVVVGNNVPSSLLSLGYQVPDSLSEGKYRIMVQGTDGGGMSEVFEIRGKNAKPDLRIKAASISSGASGNPAKPYLVKFQVTIENTGGIERRLFKVLFTVDDTNKFLDVGPLGAQRTWFVEASLAVRTMGPHQVQIVADPVNDVDESDERNNIFINPSYRCQGIPDLALACRQVSNQMVYFIKNIGDGSSPETQVVFYQRGLAIPVDVESLFPGQMVKKTLRLDWMVVQIGQHFSATVNPAGSFHELRDDNNSCEGTIVQPYETTTQYVKDWQRWTKHRTSPLKAEEMTDSNRILPHTCGSNFSSTTITIPP